MSVIHTQNKKLVKIVKASRTGVTRLLKLNLWAQSNATEINAIVNTKKLSKDRIFGLIHEGKPKLAIKRRINQKAITRQSFQQTLI